MIEPIVVNSHIPLLIAAGGLVFVLQSCGSSGSDGGGAETIFSDPVDTFTLRDALITGTASGDEDEFWRCALTGTGIEFAYRLLADGTGSETNLSNPNAQSDFTWQATSASTMTTTLDANGGQNTLIDIQFTGIDTMSLVLEPDGLMLDCSRQSNQSAEQPLAPAGNSLSYGGVVFPLTHGFEEVFAFRPQSGDTHLTAEFEVADAPFRQTIINGPLVSTTLWRPNDATVWLRADLHAPGGNGFQSATFEYEPDSTDEKGDLVAGRFFFNEGRFGIDTNEDGSIDSEFNEFFDVVGGTISVERLSNSVRMSFDITIEDGVNVTGSFTGVFPVFENLF